MFDYLFLSYPSMWGLAPISAVLGIISSVLVYKHFRPKIADSGEKRKQSLITSEALRKIAYFHRRVMLAGSLFISVLMAVLAYKGLIGWISVYCFLFGAFIFISLHSLIPLLTKTVVEQTINASEGPLSKAFINAFRNAGALNILSLSCGVLGISLCVGLCLSLKLETSQIMNSVMSFSLGVFTPAFLNSVMGGLFVKTVDIASDNIAEMDEHIHPNSIKNPAATANRAGRLLYSFTTSLSQTTETWLLTAVAAMMLALRISMDHFSLVLAILGLALLVSILFYLLSFSRAYWNTDKIWLYLRASYFFFISICIPASYYLINSMLPNGQNLFTSLIMGMMVALISAEISYYRLSLDHKPLQKELLSSKNGTAMLIVSGLANTMMSSWLPIVLLLFVAFYSHLIAGLFGISVAALGIVLTTGIGSTLRAYSGIANHLVNTGDMLRINNQLKEKVSELQKLGLTCASLIRNSDIINLMLVSLPILYYIQSDNTPLQTLRLFIIFMFGISSVLIFMAFLLKGISKMTQNLSAELRKQFSELKGLKTGLDLPIYQECIDISIKGSLGWGLLLFLYTVLLIILVMLSSGKAGTLAFMIGLVSMGSALYIILYGAGQIWSSVRQFIERDKLGGIGSKAHTASVIADSIGGPLKYSLSSSIRSYIKLTLLISILFSGFVARYVWF